MFKKMREKNPYKYNGDALVVENKNDKSKTKSSMFWVINNIIDLIHLR